MKGGEVVTSRPISITQLKVDEHTTVKFDRKVGSHCVMERDDFVGFLRTNNG